MSPDTMSPAATMSVHPLLISLGMVGIYLVAIAVQLAFKRYGGRP